MEYNSQNQVQLKSLKLGEVLGIDTKEYILKIPEYQRIYSWEEKHVWRLLSDLNQRSEAPYHLGTIILHKRVSQEAGNPRHVYDIVDGQQRLVTLSLLLLGLKPESDFPLLNESFESKLAESYVAYNKWLIQNFIAKPHKLKEDSLRRNLVFSVLILESPNLDLAYTFFSSENGKGKSLTDYDLLKSHHLRYVHLAPQAEHLADRWDDLIRRSNNDDPGKPLARTLGLHLFRLRKWMRKQSWNEWENRKVKRHFEAAPIIPDIPPFGEQFHFYETIQGGSHFFAYVEHFVSRFEEFQRLELYAQLHQNLSWEYHWWYRDVIEGLTFAYFLKFGKQYILNAFGSIMDLVSHQRYTVYRANLPSILSYVAQGEIIMMIDQATSPTFLLAEMKIAIDRLSSEEDLSGTRGRYKSHIQTIKRNLNISHQSEHND